MFKLTILLDHLALLDYHEEVERFKTSRLISFLRTLNYLLNQLQYCFMCPTKFIKGCVHILENRCDHEKGVTVIIMAGVNLPVHLRLLRKQYLKTDATNMYFFTLLSRVEFYVTECIWSIYRRVIDI